MHIYIFLVFFLTRIISTIIIYNDSEQSIHPLPACKYKLFCSCTIATNLSKEAYVIMKSDYLKMMMTRVDFLPHALKFAIGYDRLLTVCIVIYPSLYLHQFALAHNFPNHGHAFSFVFTLYCSLSLSSVYDLFGMNLSFT